MLEVILPRNKRRNMADSRARDIHPIRQLIPLFFTLPTCTLVPPPTTTNPQITCTIGWPRYTPSLPLPLLCLAQKIYQVKTHTLPDSQKNLENISNKKKKKNINTKKNTPVSFYTTFSKSNFTVETWHLRNFDNSYWKDNTYSEVCFWEYVHIWIFDFGKIGFVNQQKKYIYHNEESVINIWSYCAHF